MLSEPHRASPGGIQNRGVLRRLLGEDLRRSFGPTVMYTCDLIRLLGLRYIFNDLRMINDLKLSGEFLGVVDVGDE